MKGSRYGTTGDVVSLDGTGTRTSALAPTAGEYYRRRLYSWRERAGPICLRYEIRCDLQWRVRAIQLHLLDGSSRSLYFFTDGAGNWTTKSGESLSSLKGCLDVDISATPFTNTLPIRRLALQPGSSATLAMAYFSIPQLHVEVTQQRYTCLELTSSGGRYRFESLVDGVSRFTAELPVDEDGLVLDYPELFRRVGTWSFTP